jgi:DNA-binding response OmpR family regulator
MQTILIISKDGKTRSLLAAQLKEEGYQTFLAEDVQDAFKAVKDPEGKPDLILLDTFLVNVDSVSLDQLHAQGGNIPLLICSGANDPLRSYPPSGAFCHFLHRPVSIEEVVKKAKQLLRCGDSCG